MSAQTFADHLIAVSVDNHSALDAMAKRMMTAVNDRAAFLPVLALLVHAAPETAAVVVEVMSRACVLTRSNVLSALQTALETRRDLPTPTRRVIVEALIDAALNRDDVSRDALLAYVQRDTAARTDYNLTIALFPARYQRANELRAVNDAADPRRYGSAI